MQLRKKQTNTKTKNKPVLRERQEKKTSRCLTLLLDHKEPWFCTFSKKNRS